jgi:hypothetical protein
MSNGFKMELIHANRKLRKALREAIAIVETEWGEASEETAHLDQTSKAREWRQLLDEPA